MRWQSRLGGLVMLLAMGLVNVGTARAQEQGQKTFATVQEAGQALYKAVKADDKDTTMAILGASSASIISSGDSVQDKNNRETFLNRFEQMNRWRKETNGDETLYIGAENWPFPIPLKKAANGWYFNTKAGQEEILFRRIGKDERAAIRVCQALAAAQMDYYTQNQQYAQKIISGPGTHDGLYWKVAEGEADSPIGPLVAYATTEGYGGQHEGPQPFHGYFYRILTEQGAHVKGGAKSYIADGKMTGGFAFVAYPAEYHNSGVMTFMVDAEGVVYQKDLGPDTTKIAKEMKTYSPDASWTVAELDEQEVSNSSE